MITHVLLTVILAVLVMAVLSQRAHFKVAAAARDEAARAAADAEVAADLSRQVLRRIEKMQQSVAADLTESHVRADAIAANPDTSPGEAADAAASSPPLLPPKETPGA